MTITRKTDIPLFQDPRLSSYVDKVISALITILLAVCIWVVNGIRTDIEVAKSEAREVTSTVNKIQSSVEAMKQISDKDNMHLTSSLADIKASMDKFNDNSIENKTNIAILRTKIEGLEGKTSAP